MIPARVAAQVVVLSLAVALLVFMVIKVGLTLGGG